MTTAALSVSEASSLLMTLESSFTATGGYGTLNKKELKSFEKCFCSCTCEIGTFAKTTVLSNLRMFSCTKLSVK